MLPPPIAPLLVLLVLQQPLASVAMPPEWNLPSMPTSWVLPSGNTHRCVPIPSSMELCSNIGYSEMRLPNMLNHDTVNEVMEQTKHWVPLANMACHKEIRVLLCSIYAPVCIPQLLERQIKPCRSLCNAVMRPCSNLMKSFGFAWPEILNCTQFPPDTDLMCIQSNKDIRTGSNATADCQSCPDNVAYESIVGNYCVNNIVIKARIDNIAAAQADRVRIRLKRRVRFFKSSGLTRQQKRSIRTAVLETPGGCKCRSLEAARADPSKKLLLMGSVAPDGESFVVTYFVEWQQRSRPFKRALRQIRGGGGGSKRKRGRAAIGAAAAGGRGAGRGGSSDDDGGDGNSALCRVSQLHEPQLPTALPSAASSAVSVAPGGAGSRRKKNRRNKNKKNRNRRNRQKNRRLDGGVAPPTSSSASPGGGVDVDDSAEDATRRQRRQRRNRNSPDGSGQRRRDYAYDSFYYTNYSQS